MKRLHAFALALFASASAAASPAFAETIAITGGRVVIGDGSAPIDGGTVVIRDGQILAAGRNVPVPADARRVDASGKWVTPGIVAGFSRVGLTEVSGGASANDSTNRSPRITAGLDVEPAINPWVSAFAVSRAGGVTRAVVAPNAGGGIFGGQGAVVDLGDDENPITAARSFQFVELGEGGRDTAGGSRMGIHARFHAMLREAAAHGRGNDSFDDDLLTAEDAAALRRVINGEAQLLAHVESANDILMALGLKRQYPQLRLVLVGVSEGWRVADRIAAARVPVIASALNDLPERFENLAATQSNIGRMKNAGVQVAIGMIDDRDEHQLRYSPQYAGNLVALGKVPGATGLSWDAAFAAITSVPASIMGLGNRIGALRAGMAADVVVWSGDPPELSSAPEAVWIEGRAQSLVTRQQRLRDRYRNPAEGDLPKAYDR